MNYKKNILFGDIIVLDGKNKVKIKNAVFKEGDLYYKKNKIVEIIYFKNVGQTSTIKSYTEVNKSDEIRNTITGAYE
jgi:hypothetical protein